MDSNKQNTTVDTNNAEVVQRQNDDEYANAKCSTCKFQRLVEQRYWGVTAICTHTQYCRATIVSHDVPVRVPCFIHNQYGNCKVHERCHNFVLITRILRNLFLT